MQRALRWILVIVLFLGLAGLFTFHWAQRALLDAGLEDVDWQGLRYSSGEFHLNRVTGVYVGGNGRLRFELKEVRLEPTWQNGPSVLLLDIRDLDLDWNAGPDRTAGEQAPVSQPIDEFLNDPTDQFDASRALPEITRIHALRLELPCQAQRCELFGDLQVRNQPEQQRVTADARLQSGGDTLDLDAALYRDGAALVLESDLRLNDTPGIELAARWQRSESGPELAGHLDVPSLPESDVLASLLQPWSDVAVLPAQVPSGLNLQTSWALRPQIEPRQWQDWLNGAVQFEAHAELQQPWSLASVGLLSGALAMRLTGDRGRWLLHQGDARLRFENPVLPALEALPAELRPDALTIQIRPHLELEIGWQQELALAVEVQVEGDLHGSLTGQARVSPGNAWHARLDDGRITMQTARLEQDGLRLRNVQAELPLQAQLDAEAVQVQFGQAANVRAALASHAELGLELSDVRIGLPGMVINAPLSEPALMEVVSQTQVAASQVQHAMLRPQGWSLQGTLRQGRDGLSWSGSVATVGGLGLDVALVWPLDRPWRAEVQLQEVFFRAANPLAATLADWPELLTLATGRLRGRFDVTGDTTLERVEGRIDGSGIGGIYDRATFEGLNLPVDVAVAHDALSVQTDGLSLTSLNPGIELGPLSARLGYNAPLAAPADGRLAVRHAEMQLLGGELSVQPTVVDLSEPRQDLVIDVSGLQLSSLFEAYPAEGLSGRGTLDGQLPISLVDGQLTVDSGSVRAREPGGVLQYRSDRLSELAQSNLGMRELAVALDDFRYSVLSSELDYGEDGVLILGLRLEGSNPDLQNGRPVHLNINLEENIPALLASLQLSGQVSDIIQKRVQERLLQQRLVQ
ncbi:Dicarboxylate transport [Halopseudomonas xinjiangensis]|uniref:Dicarboxylate transport n=1 Tax=Halopseudomonas xinjiangensis TaxID=487184 RepID=A0A1H1YDQ8_9GAMM|nr:YdbH domain-containing protein [Halopseudomonas xinjiangensis]SDT19658.1 Dicarboxylate transport [Halopseudomonas xinjiangensis]